MEKKLSATGKCLCGKVEIKAASISSDLGVCHCDMCRKWGAGPYFALDCGTDVKIDGEEFVSLYDSSDWAQRGFCKNCGTSLFYKLKEKSHYMLSAEIFNDLDLNFHHQIFIDEKPSYYEFANNTEKMTGEEVFASFSDEG